MIKAKHFWLHQLFFRNYFRYILWKDFRKTEVIGKYRDRQLPLLIIGNHFSWWDGFFPYELNRKFFKRRFHIMMLEEQLIKISFFRRLGAFSINPYSRSAMQSLNYATKLMQSRDNMLILFPQGQIQSQYTTDIAFRKGWFRILKNATNPVHVIFIANLTDYFSHRKPSLYTYMEDYPKTGGFVFDDLAGSYNDFYKKCVKRQKQLA